MVRKVSEKDPMMIPGVESEEDAWEAGMVSSCKGSGKEFWEGKDSKDRESPNIGRVFQGVGWPKMY